jgi:hypothetical protein
LSSAAAHHSRIVLGILRWLLLGLLIAPDLGAVQGAADRSDTGILCELDPGQGVGQRALLAEVAAASAGRCLLLVETPQPAMSSGPRLRVIGAKAAAVLALDPGWRAGLRRALTQASAGDPWALDPYLAKTVARDGSPSVDFTVCNREQGRLFNGWFRLVLVEPRWTPDGGHRYWLHRQEIVREPIEALAEAAVVGCSLPERFGLPLAETASEEAIIAVVYDDAGSVQSLLLEAIWPAPTGQ